MNTATIYATIAVEPENGMDEFTVRVEIRAEFVVYGPEPDVGLGAYPEFDKVSMVAVNADERPSVDEWLKSNDIEDHPEFRAWESKTDFSEYLIPDSED